MPFKDPAAQREYKKKWYQQNRESLLPAYKEYREKNRDDVAAAKKRCYERIKTDDEFRQRRSEYNKARRRENKEHVQAIERRSRERHKDRMTEYNRVREKTAERLARVAVRLAIRRKALPRAKTLSCVSCSKPAAEYHHHNGYEEAHWLDVVAVCHQCHKDIHAALRGVFGSNSM